MHDRELIALLRELPSSRIAVVGDFMLDHYVWGDATRVSPEAPVPVVHTREENFCLGGAGNVVANLKELGVHALSFGVCGKDAPGEELSARLEELSDCSGLLKSDPRPTTQKIRVMARSQQVLRVDREDAHPLSEQEEAKLVSSIQSTEWDAIILSDYGKGVLTPTVLSAVFAESKKRNAPSLVDPKHRDFSRYSGATVVTPNRAEAEVAAGCSLSNFDDLGNVGESLRFDSGLDSLLITLGNEGMFLISEKQEPIHLPTAARQVFDVTGAGDTVISMLAVSLAGGLDWQASIRLANAAAGLAVAKVGTTAVGREELLHHLSASTPAHKIVPEGDAATLESSLGTLRREGMKLVFTNGCFDILHAGHVRYLQEARRMGDALVVGINSDESVRRLKGEERPFNQLDDRCEVLAALECVDLVVPFSEDTPEELIQQTCPDVLVKGADWKDKGVVGADFVEARGGEVVLVDLVPGRSTTGLADKIRKK